VAPAFPFDLSALSGPLLVTGGAGFFGSAFVRAALARRARVVTLDALTYAGDRDNLEGPLGDRRHHFVHGDVTDAALVARLFAEHAPAAVVHFAAETHVDRSIDEPAPFVTTNVAGTVCLLDAARAALARRSDDERAAFRFVQISTDEVHGSAAEGEHFNESSRLAPRSPYAASKAAADGFVNAYHVTYGLPALIVRLSNLYGPRQLPEKLIPLTVRRALENKPIGLYGDGAQRREWLYVTDACEVVLAALARGKPGAVYLAGSGEQRENLEVVRAVIDLVDGLAPLAGAPPERIEARRGLITHVADRPGHDRAYALDSSATRAALDWAPRTRMSDGLALTVGWLVAHPAFFARSAARYDGERLGLGPAAAKTDAP
jgi:dTDP-glucose 4,6-dehydratase